MLRGVLHRFVSYRKRIGNYTIRIEFIDGEWWAFVEGPSSDVNSTRDVLMIKETSGDLADFGMARWKALQFIKERIRR